MAMAELPLELISPILQILPVKTLLRFKCISKSICAIIDSIDFINSHLNTTFDVKTHRKMICRGGLSYFEDNETSLGKFLVFDMDDVFNPVLNTNNCFQLEFRNLSFYNFLAHCNGLVLLGEDWNSSSIVPLGVWNPATRQYRKLPVLPKEPPSYSWSQSVLGLGFGYDFSFDDYKVLQIIRIRTIVKKSDTGFYHDYIQFEIWILGLRSGYWRKIEDFPFDEDILDDLHESHQLRRYARNCFVDGALHFLCRGGFIIAFDMAKETFSQLALPIVDNIEGYGFDVAMEKIPYDLQVFEGCLCISFWVSEAVKVEDDVWIQVYLSKKEGDEFSWTKLLSTKNENFHSINGSLLEYSKRGDKIFVLDNQSVLLYSYDIEDENFHPIEIGGFECIDIDNRNAIFCIESLVSPYYPLE